MNKSQTDPQVEFLLYMTRNGYRNGFAIDLGSADRLKKHQNKIKERINALGLEHLILVNENIIIVCTSDAMKEYARLVDRYEIDEGKYYENFYKIAYNMHPYERINFFNLCHDRDTNPNPSIWKNVIFNVKSKKFKLEFTNVYGTDIHDNDVNGINVHAKRVRNGIMTYLGPDTRVKITINYFSYYKGLNLLREKRRFVNNLENNVVQEIYSEYSVFTVNELMRNPNAYPEQLLQSDNPEDLHYPSATWITFKDKIDEIQEDYILTNPNFTLDLFLYINRRPDQVSLNSYFIANPNINLQLFNIFKDIVYTKELFENFSSYSKFWESNRSNINLDIPLFETMLDHFDQNVEISTDEYKNIPFKYFGFNPNCTLPFVQNNLRKEKGRGFSKLDLTTTNIPIEFIVENDLYTKGRIGDYKSDTEDDIEDNLEMEYDKYYLSSYASNPNCNVNMIMKSLSKQLYLKDENKRNILVVFDDMNALCANPGLQISDILKLAETYPEIINGVISGGIYSNPNIIFDEITMLIDTFTEEEDREMVMIQMCINTMRDNIFTYNDTVYKKLKKETENNIKVLHKNLSNVLIPDIADIILEKLNVDKSMIDLYRSKSKKK